MNILQTKIKIGIEKPITLMHISDTHLTLADNRDNERKNVLAKERKAGCFPHNDEQMAEIENFARRTGDTILHTGDLIDFVSEANLEKAKAFTDEFDVFMSAGNHEFSLYVGEAVEDEAYRNQSLDKVQASFKNDIRFSVRRIGGVKFIAIDNSYYRFDEEQYAKLEKELASDEPSVLMMHNPLYEKSLYDISMKYWHNGCAYLVNMPEELMKDYPQDWYVQQKADEITEKTTELILKSSCVKAILCGHVHFDFESEVKPGLCQYVTGRETIREITVI